MLILNVILFLNKESEAVTYRFAGGIEWNSFIDAFSSTLDTTAWVILILLFELETFVIPDEKLKGSLKWILRILRSFSYIIICYAFYGYLVKYLWVADFEWITASSLCDFSGQSWMIEADEFERIESKSCQTLSQANEFLKKPNSNIITDASHWKEAFRLAITDILNSGAWILVVLVLEIDIWLQLKSQLRRKTYQPSKMIKGLLYTILLGAAIYWGYTGSLLEFWDAFLWIIAFIFIENNLFKWQTDTAVPTSIF
ncbi:MAG: hypothetical protein AAF673_05865 [Pseudomonadota bacterium]